MILPSREIATDTNLLEEENIGEMDAFVTATGLDEENLLLALMAKQRGIEDVISKVSRQSYKDLIEKMGVDMALNPLDIIASIILRSFFAADTGSGGNHRSGRCRGNETDRHAPF